MEASPDSKDERNHRPSYASSRSNGFRTPNRSSHSSVSNISVASIDFQAQMKSRQSTVAESGSRLGSRRLSSKPSKVEVKPQCYVRCSSFLVENSVFISLTTILTIYALTGDDIRILSTEKPADLYFNVMVLVCIAIFSFEIIISVMGKADYWLGFFFILDVVSTITLVLDLTWVNDLLAGGGDSSSLRSGRTARIGAKAARMIRVLRLVRILKLYKALYEAGRERARRRQAAALKARQGEDDEWDEHDDEALADAEENAEKNEAAQESTLGKKLSEMTTRRVIILILAMLLILPLLQVDDFTQAPFSAEYGADQVMESFKDFDASGSSSDQERYWHSVLTYVYYHNWYAGKGLTDYCPYSQSISCSNGFWGHLYFVGIRGQNESLVIAKAVKARLNLTVVESFDGMSEAEPAAIYNLGSLPPRAQELLAAEWNTDCPVAGSTAPFLRGVSIISEELPGVSYVVACPQDLRVTESLRYSPVWQTRQAFDEWRFEFYFDVRPFNRETAIFSLATTGFVLVLLLAGSLMFSRDANRLIVHPVEQMIRRVKEIRDNPLIAMQMADDEFKLEELRKYRQKRQGCFSRVFYALSSCKIFSASKEGPMETVILEKTIIKLGSLLALGFGEAGANIISHNMKGSDSAGVNAILPGMKVDCVIGLCRVLDFGTATEVLQGRIMTFVNQIAEIIHGVVDEFHGSPNKNSGDQFLVIWRMDTGSSSRWEDLDHKKVIQRRIAEMSILAFCKILGALHRSALLADYRTHPGLQYRLQARNGSEASEVRVNLSFGLHAGWAIEGAVGSEFKIDASYVSPNVNIASSVERCTQVYGVFLVVAQSCMELCSLEFMNKGRLIDRVLVAGSSVPMRLYCVDLDFWSLEVDRSRGPLWALSTKNRYRARQFIASQKQEKWSEECRMVTAFDSDPSIVVMRQRYTIEFFQLFNMGYQNYSQGEWLVARRMLAETKNLLGVEDGPSTALLRFMEDPYQFECPKDWNEVRDLSSMLS